MPLPVGVNGADKSATFEATVSVGTADQVLIPARPMRRFLLLINDGANTVYVSTKDAAALGAGIRLSSGATLLLDRYVPQGALRAIASTGATNILVVEGV